ncbi:MAG: serine/threonine-protein phosphatase [Deltaproteobacteria bacterium]|nr:serine/threonine-protein phosphatase [Deltaproteobacteria bacterium]
MKLKSAGNTDIGLKRKLNEDRYLVRPDLGLFVIADGMGGHKAGEVASRMVVETMVEYWIKIQLKKIPSFIEPVNKELSERANHLVNSIHVSNMLVHEAQKKLEYLQMGSTVSAVLTEGDALWVANVGDSPVYLTDKGKIILISEEHSIAAEQRSMGLHRFNSSNRSLKNTLTRVIGMHEKVNVFIKKIVPEVGDIVLLCSDGLTNYLSEDAIIKILYHPLYPLESKVRALIDGANKGGGGDNISVILIEVMEESRMEKIKSKLKIS